MVIAIIAYRKKWLHFKQVEIGLFVFFIIEMICLICFDFGEKYIVMLYFMIVGSNWASFVMFQIMVHKTQHAHTEGIMKDFKVMQIVFYVLLAIAIGFTIWPGVYCSLSHHYPRPFLYMILIHCTFCGFYHFKFNLKHLIREDYTAVDATEKLTNFALKR